MPLREMNREQVWLLPPILDELLPLDHPARFVAEFVDALGREDWKELGVEIEGDPLGAAAYYPRALLSDWLYGFMTAIRSSRKLEVACRDQIPYLWLTGWQHPDHNTLWRFYKGHRQSMRKLFRRTVRTARSWTWWIWRCRRWMGPRCLPTPRPAQVTMLRDWPGCWSGWNERSRNWRTRTREKPTGPQFISPRGLANKGNLRDQVRRAMEELEEQKVATVST